MSRIGNKPIKISTGVKVTKEGNKISVNGSKGNLSVEMNPIISFEQKDGEVILTRKADTRKEKSLHGLYAVLIKNMIHGVTEGFSKKLELVGIGYRAELKSNKLFLSLGYSHPIIFSAPKDIKIEVPSDTTILISGIDKQLVGLVAAKIRSLREPEPYKGKGIKYEGEYIRRKAGKAAAK